MHYCCGTLSFSLLCWKAIVIYANAKILTLAIV